MTCSDVVSPPTVYSSLGRSKRAATALRLTIAGLLITAALFKGYELFAYPGLPGQWLVLGQVALEWLLGVWLLSGRSPRISWYVSFGTFASFLLYSTWAIAQSKQSCGCFGRVEIDPMIIAPVDLAVLILLVQHRRSWLDSASPLSAPPAGLTLAALGFPIASLLVLNAMPAAQVDLDELIVGNGVVVLELETWVGKKFPIWPYIDVGEELMAGSWKVIFYHHDCERCTSELRLGSALFSRTFPGEQTALIQVPPYGSLPSDILLPDSWLRGRLPDRYEWFLSTPSTITLSNGIVTSATE